MKNKRRPLLTAILVFMMLISSMCSVSAAQWGFGGREQIRQQTPGYSNVRLKSSIPTANGVLSSPDTSVILQFSGDIAYSSSQRGTGIVLMKSSKTRVSVNITKNSSSRLSITPDNDLIQGAAYTLYVSGLKDTKGLTIRSFTINFTVSDEDAADDENNESTIPGVVYGNDSDNVSHNVYSMPVPGNFKDVDRNFWGYDAIYKLVQRGVIKGYSDNTFKPNNEVTRSEFASMLTKAMHLTADDYTQTFEDVPPSSWDYDAVEAARDYLTGYRTSDGRLYFYGSKDAVREDMAVALVRALNLQVESNDSELQQTFVDYNDISADLRSYVYTAYEEGLIKGSDYRFNPQATLTRAEAAELLVRALDKAEKVVVGDNGSSDAEKVAVGGSTDVDVSLKSITVNGITIPGFNPDQLTYNIELATGTTAVPKVVATLNDADNATTYIAPATGLPGTVTIIVAAKDGDGSNTRIYTVNFTVAASE